MHHHVRRGLAVLAVTAATVVAQAMAAAAGTIPTPDEPGGIEAPHSPGGLPAGGQGPAHRLWTTASIASSTNPSLVPQGANDPTCRPRAGERPVVLVPGTTETAFSNWAWMAPQLAKDGWCVWTFNYNPSIRLDGRPDETQPFSGDIRSSAAFLARFVDHVREVTGSEDVDLVGHSQGGGPLPRAYLKWYGGDEVVKNLVGITPSNHGTTVMGLQQLIEDTDASLNGALSGYAAQHNMTALPQQLTGSAFLTDLNSGGLTRPGVQYTVIASRADAVVTPWTNSLIQEPGVVNQTIQDFCPADPTGHPGASYNVVTYQLVRNALDPAHRQPVKCTFVPPSGR